MSGLQGNNMDDADGNSFLDDYELSDMFLQENPPKRDDPDQVVEARESCKRRSPSEHNLAEKRRRERIRERIEMLRQLMLNFNNSKTDKASILDNAIEYIKTLDSYVNGTSGHNYEGVIPDQAILPIGPNMENYNEGIILDQLSLLIRPNNEHYYTEVIIQNQSFLPIGPNMENMGPIDYYSRPHTNAMITFSAIGYPEPTMIPPSNVQVRIEMTNSMFFSSEQLFTPPTSPPPQSSSLFLAPPPPSPAGSQET